MRKLQIVIVFLITFSICTFAIMQTEACTTYTYNANISPRLTDTGLTGVSYAVTFTDTGSSDMGSGTIIVPAGYTAVSLTSIKASGGQSWSGSVSSSAISFTAACSINRITTGQTVTVAFSATNPSSAGAYTWKTTSYSCTCKSGTAFTISGSQPTVTVNGHPSVLVSPASWTMDVGQSKTFSATASGGSGSYSSYQWYVGGASQSGATASTFSYSPASSGSYQITATVTDSLGVTSALSPAATVTVDPPPTVIITPVDPFALDAGQSLTLIAAPAGGSGAIYYQWYLNGSAVSGATGSTYVFSGPIGSYSVTCAVTDSASVPVTSPVSNTIAIVVSASPTVSIAPAGPLTLDAGQSQVFTASAVGGSGALSYQWYVNASAVGTDSNAYTLSEPAGSYSVTCTVTDNAFVPVTSPASNAVLITVNQLTITVTQGANGVIAPGTTNVNYGDTPSFTITPNTSYYITSITVNGEPVTVTSPSSQTYQFNPVSANDSLTAAFAINTYTITVVSAYGNPTASALVNAGDSFTASVTSPDSAGVGEQWVCTGYSIDGGSAVPGTSYTFTSIQSSHTITFNWQEQYYLTTSTNFGSVVPVSGWYNAGSTVTLSASAPSTGLGEQYVWKGWTGTGTGSYSGNTNSDANAVTMNAPITETASWTHQYQVTFAVVGSGSVSPAGSNVWENAGSLSITATPNAGYTFTSWSANTGSNSFDNAYSASATATIGGTGTVTATFTITSTTPIGSSPTPTPIATTPTPTPIGSTPAPTGTSTPTPTPIGSSTSPSPTPVGSSPTPTTTGSSTSTTLKGTSSSPTPKVSATPKESSTSPTLSGSSPSPTPKNSTLTSTPLYLVLIVIIIFVAITLSVISIRRQRQKSSEKLPEP